MKKNRFIRYITCVFWVFGLSVFAQESTDTVRQISGAGAPSAEMSKNIMLARSSADYRVTPGDVYTLTYAAGSIPVTYVIAVDSSYRIRVSNLGVVNGAGKTFMQLKTEVETVVTNNYPLSGVQLMLTQPAIFRVYIRGEVHTAGEVSAWALSRLSTLINTDFQTNMDIRTRPDPNTSHMDIRTRPDPNTSHNPDDVLTSLASLRNVSIQSSNGQTRVYDLFKAQRFGDLSQDPYLRPGDVITFNRASRIVTINGAVERPGNYQLIDEENIKELIEFYGNGFTPIADKTRLELIRLINSSDIAGDKIFLTENDLTNNYVLENFDEITVPIITQLQPVMFVEGAIADVWRSMGDMGGSTTGSASDLISSNRLVVQFNKGETYASLVRKNVHWFTAVSDTLNAYILREDQHILINLNPMLYDASYRGEVFVQEDDTLVIPFRQYFITVAGAVVNPGRYPYIPDRDWEYYIALAGGFVADRNARETITITDLSGKRLKKTDVIGPETVITAHTNHFLYNFNQIAPVVTTILTIVTTALSVIMMTRSR